MWVLFLTFSVTSGVIPVLVFKNQRSGSSWMTAQLNTYKGIYIAEEIVDGLAYRRGNVWKEGQSWVMDSFSRPKRSYRWFWDEKTTKPEGDFSVLGSTLNPYFGNKFLDFQEIGRKFPNLKLVVYYRSNVVKHAMSVIRGEILFKKCGTLVLNKDCVIDDKYEVEISVLKNTLKRISVFDDALFQYATKLAPLLNNWFHQVTYEDLRKEDRVAWDRLFEFIGYVPSGTNLKEAGGRCSGNCSKTTSDDLREVIVNYEEVQSFISKEYPCLLSHFHEVRPDQAMPQIGISCPPMLFVAGGRDFDKRMQEYFIKTRHEWLDCCREDNYNCTCGWKDAAKKSAMKNV